MSEAPGGFMEKAGRIAGIAGIAMSVVVLIFKDVIQAEFMPRLPPNDAALVILLVVVLTFLIAAIGIGAWIMRDPAIDGHRVSLIAILVLCSMGFIAFLVVEFRRDGRPPDPSHSTMSDLQRGAIALRSGEYDRAEQLLKAAGTADPRSPDPLYWQAVLALTRSDVGKSAELTRRALRLDPQHDQATVLNIIVAILSGEPKQEIERKLRSLHSPPTQAWGACLASGAVTKAIFTTFQELTELCPLPRFGWES